MTEKCPHCGARLKIVDGQCRSCRRDPSVPPVEVIEVIDPPEQRIEEDVKVGEGSPDNKRILMIVGGIALIGMVLSTQDLSLGNVAQSGKQEHHESRGPIRFPDEFCIGYESSTFGKLGFQFRKTSGGWYIDYLNFERERVAHHGKFSTKSKRTDDQLSVTFRDHAFVGWDKASSDGPISAMGKLVDQNFPKFVEISGDGSIGARGSAKYASWRQVDCPTTSFSEF